MWGNGSRCAVVFTWNVDVETLWVGGFGKRSVALMERGSYGAGAGMERILRFLRDHRLPSTFYIPAWTALNHRVAVETIAELEGVEIGYSGFEGESIVGMSVSEERELVRRSLESLTEVCQCKAWGARVVPWDHNLHTARILLEEGFVYDSSLMGDDVPYKIGVEGRDDTLIEVPVSWELDDFPMFGYDPELLRGQGTASPWDAYYVWEAEFEKAYDEGGLFLLTLHPQFSGRRSRIAALERLVEYMKKKEGVWFATALEVAGGWEGPWRTKRLELPKSDGLDLGC